MYHSLGTNNGICFKVNDGLGRGPRYNGFVDATRSIIRSDGWRGLYQVCTVTTLDLCSTHLCVQFDHSFLAVEIFRFPFFK